MKTLSEVSRDAQTVAYCMFLMGPPVCLAFDRPHIIHPRTRAALDELTEAGLLEVMPSGVLPRGGAGWKAASHLCPLKDFRDQGIPRITSSDSSFPITTE